MDTIVIPLTALSKIVKQMRSDDMDYVEIMLSDAYIDDSDSDLSLPACATFHAFKASEPDFMIDYEEIEAVDVESL